MHDSRSVRTDEIHTQLRWNKEKNAEDRAPYNASVIIASRSTMQPMWEMQLHRTHFLFSSMGLKYRKLGIFPTCTEEEQRSTY